MVVVVVVVVAGRCPPTRFPPYRYDGRERKAEPSDWARRRFLCPVQCAHVPGRGEEEGSVRYEHTYMYWTAPHFTIKVRKVRLPSASHLDERNARGGAPIRFSVLMLQYMCTLCSVLKDMTAGVVLIHDPRRSSRTVPAVPYLWCPDVSVSAGYGDGGGISEQLRVRNLL